MMKMAPSKTPEKDDVETPTTKKRKVVGQEGRVNPKKRRANLKKLRFIPRSHKELRRSARLLDILRRENTQKLLQQKKLMLILDLDRTLLHSKPIANLTRGEKNLLEGPNKISYAFDGFVTKLRPHVHTFLREASEMFDMYIYTMGSRPYARRMAEVLDPQGVYFRSKVIARGDSTVPNMKGLDVVLGEERAMVILDDTRDVWGRHKESLVVIKKYHFFALPNRAHGLGRSSLSELRKDEGESNGALATTLLVLKRLHRMFFNSSENDVRKVLPKIRGALRQ